MQITQINTTTSSKDKGTTKGEINKTGNKFHPITLKVDNKNSADKEGSQKIIN